MPLYDYGCPSGHTVEVRHKIAESPEVVCEQCKQPMVKVIINAVHCDRKALPTRTGMESW